MSSMAQIATTAVQAAPLYIYSFMAIMTFECLHVFRVVGIHHLTGGKLWSATLQHGTPCMDRRVFNTMGMGA